MKIGIIIVNYSKEELLHACLRSLQSNHYPQKEIYVVDNGSTDRSLEMVRCNFPQCHIIEVGYNSGFCMANNLGIRQALSDGCRAVILLNNDTEVAPDFVSRMVSPLEKKGQKIDMVAARVLLKREPKTIDSAGLLITEDGFSINRCHGENEKMADMVMEVFCPCGTAALYSSDLLGDVVQAGQYLDEDYEYYFEELDLGWRARLRGYRCLYNPAAIVYHHKSATAGQYSDLVAYHTNKNILFNIVKNYPSFRSVLSALLLLVFHYLLIIFNSISKKGISGKIRIRSGYLGMGLIFFRSICRFLRHFPKMLGKRRYVQSRKNVSSEEMDRWFKELSVSFRETKSIF